MNICVIPAREEVREFQGKILKCSMVSPLLLIQLKQQ